MQLGNTIKLNNDVDPEEKEFLINTIGKYIHCISVMAKRVRDKRRFIVRLEECDESLIP